MRWRDGGRRGPGGEDDGPPEPPGRGDAGEERRDFYLQAIIKVSNSFSAIEILAAPPQSLAQTFLVLCATSVSLERDSR